MANLDISYCYRILKEGTSTIGANAIPTNLTDLTLHGVQMSAELLTELVDRLTYIKVLTLCGMMAVDDDTLDNVSKLTTYCFKMSTKGVLTLCSLYYVLQIIHF